MPITQQQLESIKAANYAKSVAWEAEKFLPGDIVLTHGHTVRRTGSAWTCTKTGTEYMTLSRWIRHKLNRNSFNVKWCTFLIVGSTIIQMACVPSPAERHLYSPWTEGRDRYYPKLAPAPAPLPASVPERQTGVETIKATNYAKSVSWEAAHFLPSEVVALYGHRATRTENGWTCNQSGLQYATLSRWGRVKLHRETFNPKYYCFLIVGQAVVHLSRLPPVVERRNYSPWVVECPRYDPNAAPAPAPAQQDVVTSVPPATAAPASKPSISHLDGIEGHLNYIDAATTEQNKRLNSLEDRTESCQEDHHKRILALQARVDYLEERLLAVAAVAAHISLFKDRIAELDAKCKNI